MPLTNPNYDFEQLVETIANESPTFKKHIESTLDEIGAELPEQKIWLGTLQGKNKADTQVQLVITQTNFIDEE